MEFRRMVTYDGRTQSVRDWAKELGMKQTVLSGRMTRGWDVERAFHQPVRPTYRKRRYLYHGKEYSLRELAKLNPTMTKQGMKNRIQMGMSIEEAVERPNRFRIKALRGCGLDCFQCPYDDCVME